MDIYEKVANNIKLTPQEMELWKSGFNKPIAVTQSSGGLVFYETLAVAKASVTIQVPSSCDNLLIIGTGRISAATGGVIWIQINADTGNTYTYQAIKTDGTTVTTFAAAATSKIYIGVFSVSGATADVQGSFYLRILNCYGAFHKNMVGLSYDPGGTSSRTHYGTWASTKTIQTIELFGTDNTNTKGSANIAAGSVFSAYQMK